MYMKDKVSCCKPEHFVKAVLISLEAFSGVSIGLAVPAILRRSLTRLAVLPVNHRLHI